MRVWQTLVYKLKTFLRKVLVRLGLVSEEVYYLGGPDTLPPPLAREEEEVLVHRLRVGEETREVKQTLIERNLRLVVYIARKFTQPYVALDDLIGIGTIGLIKAVHTFDPEKNIKLATYASRCIENEILMHLRKANRLRHEVSLEEPLTVDSDGNELLIADVLGHGDEDLRRGIEAEVDRELLRQAIATLNERERTIVELRFGLRDGHEYTQKEVADLLGISQSYISRLEKRILRRLEVAMSNMA